MFQLYIRLTVTRDNFFCSILLVRFEHRQWHDVQVDLSFLFKTIRIYVQKCTAVIHKSSSQHSYC